MASLRKEKWRAPPTPGAERRPLVDIWRPPGDSPAPGTTYPRRNKGFCARRFRLPEDFEARRSAAKSGRAGQRDAPKASREGPFQVQGTPETPEKERRKGTGWHQHPRRTRRAGGGLETGLCARLAPWPGAPQTGGRAFQPGSSQEGHRASGAWGGRRRVGGLGGMDACCGVIRARPGAGGRDGRKRPCRAPGGQIERPGISIPGEPKGRGRPGNGPVRPSRALAGSPHKRGRAFQPGSNQEGHRASGAWGADGGLVVLAAWMPAAA
jgi:hypothetical protein